MHIYVAIELPFLSLFSPNTNKVGFCNDPKDTWERRILAGFVFCLFCSMFLNVFCALEDTPPHLFSNLQVLLPSKPSSCKTTALSSSQLPILLLLSFRAFFILRSTLFLSLNVLYSRFNLHSFERAHLLSIFETGRDSGRWWQYLDISCLWDFETSKLLSLLYHPSTQIPSWNIFAYSWK